MSKFTEAADLAKRLADLIALDSVAHAQIVSRLVEALNDELDVDATFCTLSMWGGSGSVADYLPPDAIRREATELLVALRDAMAEQGIICPRADQWTRTFRYWLDGGII